MTRITDNKKRTFQGRLGILVVTLALAACGAEQTLPDFDHVIISVIGTNDVHGELLPKPDRGGLVTISGYVNALRQARDDGAVLLIDAGDMWQGTLESNLSEGETTVAAYNALGYTAAAIGNHEFDFGPLGDAATPRGNGDDARGALKRRASEADFPLLSANLLDAETERLVEWPNVHPSILVERGGVSIGIIGVLTSATLQTTIAANTAGLRVAPLATSIEREADALRAAGADLVIVSAHAGGHCEDFSEPADLATCDMRSEIMQVANALPSGLVDHIIAGHVHDGIAHVVNGIAITSSYSRGYAFSRVDFTVDRQSGDIVARRIHPPQVACPYRDARQRCVYEQSGQTDVEAARYEGFLVEPDPRVLRIALDAERRAREYKRQSLGAFLETPFTLKGNPESALANLMTNAILESVDGDIAIHNVSGGIRATLPAGELTFGSIYEMFPFDNRVVIVELTGKQLREVIAAQARKSRRRAGFSGMHVEVGCKNGILGIEMTLDGNRRIADHDRLRVVVNDFLALGGDGILTPVMPSGGFSIDDELPMARDVLVSWFRNRGSLRADDFLSGDRPRWRMPAELPPDCAPGAGYKAVSATGK